MFPTGICEAGVSKRTVITVISGLKELLAGTILTVHQEKLNRTAFENVVNRDGCLYLSGHSPRGRSLYELYRVYEPVRTHEAAGYYTAQTVKLIRTLRAVIDALLLIRDRTGCFPDFLLNSVYFDAESGAVSFLPYPLIYFLDRFMKDEEQRDLFAVATRITGSTAGTPAAPGRGQTLLSDSLPDESAVSLTFARILYLFFSKGETAGAAAGADCYDIRSYVPDAPRELADRVWDALHGKSVSLAELRSSLAPVHAEAPGTASSTIPFGRRKGFLTARYGILRFLEKRKALLIAVLLAAGAAAYFTYDLVHHRNETDYTLGMQPRQVVDLYFRAVDDLDPAILDSVFSRGAGRDIRNEVSRLYVTTKLEQVFTGGGAFDEPQGRQYGTGGEPQVPEHEDTYGIRKLEIRQKAEGLQPVFEARYEKYFNADGESTVHSFRETIYLKQYRDHWYIIRIDRSLADGENRDSSETDGGLRKRE